MRHKLISISSLVLPLAWAACGDGESSTSNEAAWTRAERLNLPLGNSYDPKVSMSTAAAFVVWSQEDGEHPSVFGKHYNPKSGSWGKATLLEENEVDESGGATVAVDAKGNAIAVWWQYDGTPSAHIFASYYDASDEAWEPPERLDLSSDGDSRTPRVAMNGAGDAMVTWSQRDDGNRFKVYAAFRPQSTKSWSKAESISLENEASAFNPQVVVDASGHAIAAWEQYSDANHIFVARYEGTWREPIAVDSTGDAWAPSLAGTTTGDAVVAWYQFVDGVSVVHAARFEAQDGSWAAPDVVSQPLTNAYHPTVAIGEANEGLVVWTQEDEDAPS